MSETGARRYLSPEESFLARTTREGECLVWTGTRKPSGYGEINGFGDCVCYLCLTLMELEKRIDSWST